MEKRAKGSIIRGGLVLLAPMLILIGITGATAAAKSLYVIADMSPGGSPTPIQAYDIAPDGTLTLQTTTRIPTHGAGTIGLAIDSDSQYLFVSYENSSIIRIVDAATLTDVEREMGSGDQDDRRRPFGGAEGSVASVIRLTARCWSPVPTRCSSVARSGRQHRPYLATCFKLRR